MSDAKTNPGRILLVDDEPANVRLLEILLQRRGFPNVASTTDPRKVASLFDSFKPDIVLLDLRMPEMDGFEVLAQLGSRIPAEEFLPIIVLTGELGSENKLRALAAGAIDFLTKPVDTAEVMARIQNLLKMRALQMEIISHKCMLEERVRERTIQLHETQIEVVDRLGRAREFRDDDTGQHTDRVGEMAARIARQLGMDDGFVDLIRQAAPLHDIGKVGIPDGILLKPGKLTPEEWATMKSHTTIGAKILAGSPHRLLNMAEEIALTHHERPDGKGYAGLSREDIPISGRIVAVADVFDALTHERPYKQAWPADRAREEMLANSGTQFDPQVMDAFIACMAADPAPCG